VQMWRNFIGLKNTKTSPFLRFGQKKQNSPMKGLFLSTKMLHDTEGKCIFVQTLHAREVWQVKWGTPVTKGDACVAFSFLYDAKQDL
jgi:hypothetical protein